MDLKSIASLVYKVSNLDKTARFYDSLGFRAGNRDKDRYVIYLNWFSVEFQAAPQKEIDPGKGQFTCIKVDNVDAAFESATTLGLKPSRAEADVPWGHGEFVVNDPDGYRLVFFNKK